MRRITALALLAGALATGKAAPTAAQQATSKLLAVGEAAPDFALPGATRYGLLQDPVKLSDYRGETVVLAFFFKVRTAG
jgi:thioredoxin-dependent peroxiredoxin